MYFTIAGVLNEQQLRDILFDLQRVAWLVADTDPRSQAARLLFKSYNNLLRKVRRFMRR